MTRKWILHGYSPAMVFTAWLPFKFIERREGDLRLQFLHVFDVVFSVENGSADDPHDVRGSLDLFYSIGKLPLPAGPRQGVIALIASRCPLSNEGESVGIRVVELEGIIAAVGSGHMYDEGPLFKIEPPG